MKKAVIYARFSCSAQNEQSIEGQLRVCNEYAQRNNIAIIKEYIDRAKSGKTDARPSFQEMIADSNQKQWDYVLVYKLDRFSRDKFDSAIYKRALKQNGIRVISATENIPDTPEAIIFESVLEGFAQYYSAELSQKVRRGLKENYLKGEYTGGSALPFGYYVKDKKVYIDELEAPIVLEIFNKYVNNHTAKTISKDLCARGITNKKGRSITPGAIYKILDHLCYTGKIIHNGTTYDNIFPRIIPEDLWKRANAIHQRHIHSPKTERHTEEYLLTYKLRCGYCGTKMTGTCGKSRNGTVHQYYICNRKKHKVHDCEQSIRIRKEEIEKLVMKTTYALLTNNNYVDFIAKGIVEQHKKACDANNYLAALEKQRSEAIKACDNIMKAIEAGIFNQFTQSRFEELSKTIKDLDLQIAEEKYKTHATINIDQVKEFLKSVPLSKITDSISTQKEMLGVLLKEVIAYKDTYIIVYNFEQDTSKLSALFDENGEFKPGELPSDISTIFNDIGCSVVDGGSPKYKFLRTEIGTTKCLFSCSEILVLLDKHYISRYYPNKMHMLFSDANKK